jgi:hypothetical protein
MFQWWYRSSHREAIEAIISARHSSKLIQPIFGKVLRLKWMFSRGFIWREMSLLVRRDG